MFKIDRYFFLCFVFLIFNLVQALYTNLIYDEAYYWLYSQHLAWGYFDHPPLVALFIKLGYAIFQNELGARLIGAFSNFFILLLIPKILDIENNKEKLIVFFICASLPLFQLFGFIATPDAPLLFFSGLYFYLLKTFYKEQNAKISVLLGLTIALMAYSKYHAFLLVFLTLLSNVKLIKNKYFIFAMFISLFAFLPHIIWQINNNFISFKYHLSGRHEGFEFYHFPEYFLNLVIILNPFLLVFIFKSLAGENIKNDFQYTLRFIFIGTLAFFLACNFLGHVQPQWLVIGTIPLILLLFSYIKNNRFRVAKLNKVFLLSCFLFFIIRSVLIFDVLPFPLEFHSYKKRLEGIIRKSQGLPIIFKGNYRLASVYAFKTKNKNVHSYGNRSAFNEWKNGKRYNSLPVMLVGSNRKNRDTINLGNGQVEFFSIVKSFSSQDDLELKLDE